MDKRIDELRTQRDLVQKHLDWLNSELAEAEGSETSAPEASPAPATPPASPALSETHAPPVAAPDTTAIPEKSSIQEEDEPEPHKLVAPVQNDVRRATVGCAVFFILATAIFLFLLFGLPYLL